MHRSHGADRESARRDDPVDREPQRRCGESPRADLALAVGARWLAFTDADTVVTPAWLAAQLALKVEAVVGTVAVDDWGVYGPAMQKHFETTYTDADGHRHIHGANLGVSAAPALTMRLGVRSTLSLLAGGNGAVMLVLQTQP